MDFELQFIATLLAGGKDAFKKAHQKGVRTEFFGAGAKKALDFTYDYINQYHELPSKEIICNKAELLLPDPSGSVDFFIDEAISQRILSLLRKGSPAVAAKLDQGLGKEAFDEIKKLVKLVNNDHIAHEPAESMFKQVPKVLELYERLKKGERGIPLPFPSMMDATLGMWPQDLLVLVSKSGTGKTWFLLLCARVIWKAGYRVLVATTEMAKFRIAQRFFAMDLKLPYNAYRKGELNPFVESKMYEILLKLMEKDDGRLKVIGGDFDFRIENLEAEVDDFMPHVILLDGAYLLRSQGTTRNEQATNAFNDLKRLANRSQIPTLVSTQFNRDAKRNSPNTAQTDNIGLSDVAAWNADAIFALMQTEDMAKSKRMLMKFLKIREGKGEDVELNWDIETMTFEELEKTTGPGPNPFSTGDKTPSPKNTPTPDNVLPFSKKKDDPEEPDF